MNRLYNTILTLFFVLIGTAVFAQTNFAPSATMATNVLGNSAYPLSNMNDKTIVACNSWTSNGTWFNMSNSTTGEYIEWTWTSAKSVSKMIIYYGETGNRFMDGATIEYYNGTTWVSWYSFSSLNSGTCQYTITFNSITTTGIRLTNMNIVGTQNTNPCFREIELFGPTVNNDAAVTSITSPTVCNFNQAMIAKVSNLGKKTLDSFRLYWSVNSTLQSTSYVKSKLAPGKDTFITLNPSFTFVKNTNYQFKSWTWKPNGTVDSLPANDTFTRNVAFIGFPNPPTTINGVQCGGGKAYLRSIPASISDSISWFDDSLAGKFIGLGKNIYSPFINKTTKFYAQVGGGSRLVVDNGGFTGGTIVSGSTTVYNGAYFNITPSKTIFLDSLMIHLYQNLPTGFKIYYKVGTHVGSETNSSAWTLLTNERGRIMLINGKYMARVNAGNPQLSANQTYGFYLTTDPTLNGNDFYLTNGTNPKSNADVSFTGSVVVNSLFGSTGLYTTWMIDIELMYGFGPLSPCNATSPRVPITITVKPRPIGADISKGSPFNGQFRVGDFTTPDVAEVGKTITYVMTPPNGFSNANQGSAWIVNNVSATTKYGYVVPNTEYTFTNPSGSGPGTLVFTPKSTYLDSFITFSIKYSDLGPYFCDSTVKRTVIVAPTPFPNFKVPSSICLGDAVLFDNITTIHSGNASYTWYFGDGDSADLLSPVHEYLNPGVYQVKLVAKSFPWNVLHDTTITVEVGELPAVKFRANNKCQGIPVGFQNQTTVGNGALTYDWDFGDNSAHSTATNPNHNYATPGGYKVTLKATANGCVATLIKNAYSFARPVANFAAPLAPVCAQSEVAMPNTSTIALGNQGAYWRFGDGGSSTQYDGNHTYASAGTYAVKLLAVSEFDCKDSITKNVTIKATPNPDFNGNQFCGKIPTIFTNSTFEALPNPVYNWSFSDGFISSLKSLTRTWPTEGPYSATLKATYSNGCSSSVTKDFTVLIQPKADFSAQDVCSGVPASFVNLSTGDRGNIQYFWDFGNGTNSTVPAPVRLYNPSTTTTYTVSLVASYPGGCSDTTSKTITVSESPICDFTFKDLGLLNASFAPSNTSYSKYEWFFGEGGTSKQKTPNYQYLYSGSFNVTMSATNAAGCSCEITKRVSATTGVNSFATTYGISIYPNPNAGNFTISNSAGNGMHVEIYNVMGELVFSGSSAEGNLQVNLINNASGIYLLKITINGETSMEKIVVSK